MAAVHLPTAIQAVVPEFKSRLPLPRLTSRTCSASRIWSDDTMPRGYNSEKYPLILATSFLTGIALKRPAPRRQFVQMKEGASDRVTKMDAVLLDFMLDLDDTAKASVGKLPAGLAEKVLTDVREKLLEEEIDQFSVSMYVSMLADIVFRDAQEETVVVPTRKVPLIWDYQKDEAVGGANGAIPSEELQRSWLGLILDPWSQLGDRPIWLRRGVVEIAEYYKTFLVSDFGVLHDGRAVFPWALDALEEIRIDGYRVEIVVENPKINVQALGLKLDDHFDDIVIAGSAQWLTRMKKSTLVLGGTVASIRTASLLGMDTMLVCTGSESLSSAFGLRPAPYCPPVTSKGRILEPNPDCWAEVLKELPKMPLFASAMFTYTENFFWRAIQKEERRQKYGNPFICSEF